MPDMEPAREIDIVRYLTEPVERGRSPGLVAAVTDAQGVRAIAADGVRKQGSSKLITVDDLVHIGSNTKAMTSTMLATLVEDGTFPHGWATTLADVFPALLEDIHPGYHSVDLYELVRMTGGIPRDASDWGAYWDAPDIIERRYAILRDNLTRPPAGPSGEFLYSNLSYMIAGAMAERLTGESWETLMAERLFAPLGMTTAGFGPPGTPGEADQPWGHARGDSGEWTPLQFDNPEALGPAGRVHLSVEDWAKFIALWFTGEAPAVLVRSSLDKLTAPEADDYAAGWFVLQRAWAGGTALFHDGSNTVWSTVLWIAPDRGIAYLAAANAADSLTDDAIFPMLDSIIGSLIGETEVAGAR